MRRPVIFPARRILQSSNNYARVPFEVFSLTGLDESFKKILEPVSVDGEVWKHYLAEMSRDEYRDFLSNNDIHQGKHADLLSLELFSKFFDKDRKTQIMGILNVTPDSFYPGSRIIGKSLSEIDAVLEEGPDIIDIGGESTRPGSDPVPPEEEIRRIKPVLEYISTSYDIPISVDTRNPETAEFSLRFGVKYLNDVSGFRSREMMQIAAENSLECILMHMRGEPKTMQASTEYADLLFEINLFFQERVNEMITQGIHPSRIILDPGIGFGKGMVGNGTIIRELDSINLGFRTLVGHSRKTFIGKVTGHPVEQRLGGTLGVSLYLRRMGVDILRVHDVLENKDALQIYDWLGQVD